MPTGYTRQAAANIAANLPIRSADVNAEFNQLQSAFDNSAGHDHSGGAAGTGAKLSLTASVTGVLPLANGGTSFNASTGTGLINSLLGNGSNTLTPLNGVSITGTLISSGALTISSGGAAITGNSTITGNLTLTGSGGSIPSANLTGTIAAARIQALAKTQVLFGNSVGALGVSGMFGLGSSCVFTPTQTGNALIILTGDISVAGGITTVNYIMKTGTGSAPANAAAVTGTSQGESRNFTGTSGQSAPFSMIVYLTGLTLSTQIWVDVAVTSIAGVPINLTDVALVATELY